MPRFTLLRRGKVVKSVLSEEDLVRIGRLPGLEITLEGRTVSREHARIRREGQAFLLEDAGSLNGVRLNGVRVKCHPLVPHDRILIEEFEVVYEPSEEVFVSGLDPDLQRFIRTLGDSDPSLTFLNVNRLLDGK